MGAPGRANDFAVLHLHDHGTNDCPLRFNERALMRENSNADPTGHALNWDDGVYMHPLDDGHTPEGLPKGQGQYVAYPSEAEPAVHVTDEAVPSHVCQAWYETMTASDNPTWGTYVTLDEIYEYWRTSQSEAHTCPDTRSALSADLSSCAKKNHHAESQRHALAVAVASVLIRQVWELQSGDSVKCLTMPPTVSYTLSQDDEGVRESTHGNAGKDAGNIPSMPPWWRERKAHGVAVWALASQKGAAVPYHVDYAEQVRYQHNILATPLWGGILQCTPGAMVGGDYYVYVRSPDDSLKHYQQHGYKAQRQKPDAAQAVYIPYRANRLISQAGYLPHGSTAVIRLSEPANRRVVVGLNVFGDDVARLVQDYPEHSPRFNDWVKSLRQARSEKVSLRSLVAKHPNVARKLLKRQRQLAFQKAVKQLESDVRALLNKVGSDGMSLSQIQSTCANTNDDGSYPSPTDVQVYIEQQCRLGWLHVSQGSLDRGDAVVVLVCKRA